MPSQLPDGRWLSDDQTQVYDGASWAPYAPPQAAPPPPPPPAPPAPPAPPSAPPQPVWNGTAWVFPQAAPALPHPGNLVPPQLAASTFQSGLMPPAPQAPGQIPLFVPQAPPPQAAPPLYGAGPSVGEVDVASFAWGSGHALGKGFVILIEDIELNETKAGDPRAVFTGKTLQDNGAIAAGYKSVFGFMLTTEAKDGKQPGIGKLGNALLKMKITKIPDPRNSEGLVSFLRDKLRGVTIVADCTESKKSDFPDFNVVGLFEGGHVSAAPAPSAPAPQAVPSGPPPPPPPIPNAGYNVSFSPPPPGAQTAFHSV